MPTALRDMHARKTGALIRASPRPAPSWRARRRAARGDRRLRVGARPRVPDRRRHPRRRRGVGRLSARPPARTPRPASRPIRRSIGLDSRGGWRRECVERALDALDCAAPARTRDGQLPAIAALGRQPPQLSSREEAASRLDALLVERGLAASRERARALILAGQVRVDGQPVDEGRHAGAATTPTSRSTTPDHPYVGRGGLKLAHALDAFGIDVTGATRARHRRLDRRLHRRAAAARRARTSSRSTSATASSTGSCAATRASS